MATMRCEADSSEPSACCIALRGRMQATPSGMQCSALSQRMARYLSKWLANAIVHRERDRAWRDTLPAFAPRALSCWLWIVEAMYILLVVPSFQIQLLLAPVAKVLAVSRKALLLQPRVFLLLRERCILRLLPLSISFFAIGDCIPRRALGPLCRAAALLRRHGTI